MNAKCTILTTLFVVAADPIIRLKWENQFSEPITFHLQISASKMKEIVQLIGKIVIQKLVKKLIKTGK